MEFARAIEKIIYPLKIFKINPKEISLIICISIAFIPIFIDQINTLKHVLKAKGVQKNYTLGNIKIIINSFLSSAFQRVNEIETSLRAKGYEGE